MTISGQHRLPLQPQVTARVWMPWRLICWTHVWLHAWPVRMLCVVCVVIVQQCARTWLWIRCLFPSSDIHHLALLGNTGSARRKATSTTDKHITQAPDGRIVVHDGQKGASSKLAASLARRGVGVGAGAVAGKGKRALRDSDNESAMSDMSDGDDMDTLEFNEPMTHKLKKKMQKDDHYSSSDSEPDSDRQSTAAGAGARKGVTWGRGGSSGAGGKGKKTKSDTTGGSDYKSKFAAGDVKRKGRPDPFAYVPLDPKQLNKRYVCCVVVCVFKVMSAW